MSKTVCSKKCVVTLLSAYLLTMPVVSFDRALMRCRHQMRYRHSFNEIQIIQAQVQRQETIVPVLLDNAILLVSIVNWKLVHSIRVYSSKVYCCALNKKYFFADNPEILIFAISIVYDLDFCC